MTFVDLIEMTAASAQSATYGGSQKDRRGFFTDTTLCIGCKACEVACKEWNQLPQDGYDFTGMSYDNTQGLSGSTWRHVAFVEQIGNKGRWLMESDVCKHCTHAGCLDVCPTGAIVRTEFGTVVIQDDVCNGCGYCIVACPFGVITERVDDADPSEGTTKPRGTMGKCTLCYDRLKADEPPACAKACPTTSIQYGNLDELRDHANARVEEIRTRYPDARLYLDDADDGIGGGGSIFLLLDRPEIYGLPPNPFVPTKRLPEMWRAAGIAAAFIFGAVAVANFGR